MSTNKDTEDLVKLLDVKYTPKELEQMMSQFKVGQKVEISSRHLLWTKEHAYVMHTVGAKEENGVIVRKQAENAFFIDLYIGNGFPYEAEIVQLLTDVGDKLPGARVKVSLPNGLSSTMIMSVLDFY